MSLASLNMRGTMFSCSTWFALLAVLSSPCRCCSPPAPVPPPPPLTGDDDDDDDDNGDDDRKLRRECCFLVGLLVYLEMRLAAWLAALRGDPCTPLPL